MIDFEKFYLHRTQVASTLINQEKSAKLGVKNKTLKAGWDEKYLEKIMGI